MNGAESLVRTLVGSGVNVCFTNPGTSEMHFVAALDRVDGMTCVLGLFEGVVTGAADGYYRIAGKPASTLLHLGPGLGNGLANLHNARRARSGIVNIIGEHATHHIPHDAPLAADIEGIARPMSNWVKTSKSSTTLAAEVAEAIQVARQVPGNIATLIVPADNQWSPATNVATAQAPAAPKRSANAQVALAAQALRGADAKSSMLLIGGAAVTGRALELAGRIAAKTGCQLAAEYNNARLERGAGRVNIARIPYPVDAAVKMLKDVRRLVLVGAKVPVAFFAYPDKPSVLVPKGCYTTTLATVEEDLEYALEALAAELDAVKTAPANISMPSRPSVPHGAITQEGIAAILGAYLPENAIVVDEAITTGRGFASLTAGAPPHDWLAIMGGAIGFALPCSVGAAIAARNRKVVALEGDGSAMYTLQALWTMARNSLDVTILVFANRSYQILRGELAGVGAGTPGAKATDMLTIDRPDLDWVGLAKAQGAEAGRATTLEELEREFKRGLATSGPYLIEVVL
jgi:acetolactate synthase I/II/III large subunit